MARKTVRLQVTMREVLMDCLSIESLQILQQEQNDGFALTGLADEENPTIEVVLDDGKPDSTDDSQACDAFGVRY